MKSASKPEPIQIGLFPFKPELEGTELPCGGGSGLGHPPIRDTWVPRVLEKARI